MCICTYSKLQEQLINKEKIIGDERGNGLLYDYTEGVSMSLVIF